MKNKLTAIFFVLGLCTATSAENLCTETNKQLSGRVVFGEARGEPFIGQVAVAWTIVNRVNNHQFDYPNTVYQVVYQKHSGIYDYNTMGSKRDTMLWNDAKSKNSTTYQNAIKASSGALCGTIKDPTDCALAYCAYDPCSATSSTKYAIAYNKKKIGQHYFVCFRPRM